ncbi:MAG: endo-1,4-beta-xylanase, partial [Lachnospiraceae bacterium]|nr:endo-1,4-beta-xylanase [Lachnospiraceae bacterium]
GLLPYTNSAFGTSEDGLLTVEGAKEDIILLPDEYINNTFVQIGRGMWDDLVKEEPARYHNALTNGGVPHIYTEYNAPHNEGVWEPGFYSFILNAFKLIKIDESQDVSISKDNEYSTIEVDNVVYSQDGVSFTAKPGYGGGGMIFWPAGAGKSFNLSNYAKMVVELTAEKASVPMSISMYKNNPANVWGDTMSLSDSWFETSKTAGDRTVIEYDLNKIQGEDREGDLYGIGLRIRGWESNNSYSIKIHSITFIPSEPIPELTSLKSVVEPVFGHIGTCINSWQLKQIKTVKYVAENYTSISLENEMKPDAILREPINIDDAKKNTGDYIIPDNYTEETVPKLNFETVDEVLRIAKERGLKLRAHTLVWHGQTPEFFFREGYNEKAAYVDEETMNARLEMYIRSVMHHVYTLDDGAYKDVVYTWDIANEYMHNDADANWSAVYGNRSTKLKNKPGYIKLAFQIAHDCLEEYGIADKVTLVYNDFNTYFDCRDNIIEMINYFNAEEKICDGVGMQSHLGVGFPSVEGYLETVEAFIKAGFDVQITELDIGTDNKTYEVQAEYVKRLMEGLRDIQDKTHKIKGITWWGLCDTSSWRGENDPLLFGKTMYDAKPAYYSFINAFNKE